jgi:hypothetical protein
MTTYNGHKNWNHWNVSLWINNDEGLYRLACSLVRACSNRDLAAMRLAQELAGEKTPDGAPYSYSSVRSAIRDI